MNVVTKENIKNFRLSCLVVPVHLLFQFMIYIFAIIYVNYVISYNVCHNECCYKRNIPNFRLSCLMVLVHLLVHQKE